MCVTEIYIDRFPDMSEVEFRQLRLCQYGRPGIPCETHSTLENTPRNINWGEPTSEFIMTQMNTPPRSSTSSDRPSIRVIRDESPRPRRRRPGLLMSAFFGDPPRRRRSRRENIVVVNGPPSPSRSPYSPRTPPPPAPAPRNWGIPSLPRTPEPFVYDASPTRGRRVPAIVVDSSFVNGQRQRQASSAEANIGRRAGRRATSRSPSPTLSDIHREDAERELERRRRRDNRAAELEEELRERQDRRRREERRALHDAEINARPAVPPAPQPLRRRSPQLFSPVIEQSNHLQDMLEDLHLSARGERVIAEAVADRRRMEERERMIRAGIEAEDAEEQRARLRRRFTIGPGPRRRDRIMYDDGSRRYDFD